MISLEDFISKANKKYKNKFDYTKFIITNWKTKSIIVCPEHGEFLQNPDKHLQNAYGCPKCAKVLKHKPKYKQKTTAKQSVAEVTRLLTEKFSLLSFVVTESFVHSRVEVTCNKHGSFTSTISNLLSNNNVTGCKGCGKEKSAKAITQDYTTVIAQCKEKYNNKYKYTDCEEYKNKNSKIDIECPIHGMFKKSVSKHLAGQECQKCTLELNIKLGKYPGGYNEETLKCKELREKPAVLYYVKIGELFKIGITINLKRRLNSLSSMFKTNVELLHSFNGTLHKMYKLEQLILATYHKDRIYTKQSTEMFSENILKSLDLIK